MQSRTPAAAALLVCACVPSAQTVEPECLAAAAAEQSPPPPAKQPPPCDRCCAAIDHTGPSIVEARWDPRRAVVDLTLSKPVRNVHQVAPEQFRLSFASASEGGGAAEVSYYDPLYYFDGGDAGGDDDLPELLQVVALEAIDDRHVRLTVSHPLDADGCGEADEGSDDAQDTEVEGVFLHYTNGRRGLEDEAGNRMRSFGAAWADRPRSVHASATGSPPVHRLDLLIPVRCDEGGD